MIRRIPRLVATCSWLLLLLVCGSIINAASVAAGSTGFSSSNPPWRRNTALKYCNDLEESGIYDAIHDDLSVWKGEEGGGITREMMAASILKFTTRSTNKGIAVAFRKGVAYVVEATLNGPVGHHASIYFVYLKVILELQYIFGRAIPDVEFVIASSDRPMVSLNRTDPPYLPVFRFCSSAHHADIQVPIFHFYSKKYDRSMLKTIAENNEKYPWETKKEVLFGRFSNYLRYIDTNDTYFRRLGTAGQTICKVEGLTTACRVRQHFAVWALRRPDLIQVKSSPKVTMAKHAAYKYLLHLDGQALSSRLDLLLPLNSLIFKEESGYSTWYHHMLKPNVHYLPVWKKVPDDVLTAIEWAKSHDDQAKEMATTAQAFALKYLNKKVRTCYWFKLLREFSKLLRYSVSPDHEVKEKEEEVALMKRRAARRGANVSMLAADASLEGGQGGDAMGGLGKWRTMEEYLEKVPLEYEGGRWVGSDLEGFDEVEGI